MKKELVAKLRPQVLAIIGILGSALLLSIVNGYEWAAVPIIVAMAAALKELTSD